jgi:tetratricopeptide (TPR) repeat protein
MIFRSSISRHLTGVAIVFGIICLAGCVKEDSGKIPLTTKSDEARQYFLEGRELQEKLRGTESLVYFRKAVEADSTFAMAYLYLAFAQSSARDFFSNYYQSTSLLGDVSEGERLWILSVEAGINGEAGKQENLLTRLVKAYPNDERAHTQLGNFYFGRQDYPQAIAEYEQARAIDPKLSQIYNQLGYSYRFLGQYEKAETAFKEYTKLIPNDPNPYDSYAELLMKTGRFRESLEMYRKALQLNSRFIVSHLGIASDFMYLGFPDSALTQLQVMYDASQNDGQRRTALLAMATVYVDEENLVKGLELVQEQFSLAAMMNDKPSMSADMSVMGTLLLEAGRPEEARDKFEMALVYLDSAEVADEVKQAGKEGLEYSLGRVEISAGNVAAAREHFQAFMDWAQSKVDPIQIRQGHQLQGLIEFAVGNYGGARDAFLQANLQNPYNLFRIGQTYEAEGDRVSARQWYADAAHFNSVSNLAYALIRKKALAKVDSLKDSAGSTL